MDMRKLTFFCLNAALDTLHEDLCAFYCCQQHILAIKALLCKTQYFYVVDSDRYLSKSDCTVVFPLQQWLHKHTTILQYVYVSYLVLQKICSGKNRSTFFDKHLYTEKLDECIKWSYST